MIEAGAALKVILIVVLVSCGSGNGFGVTTFALLGKRYLRWGHADAGSVQVPLPLQMDHFSGSQKPFFFTETGVLVKLRLIFSLTLSAFLAETQAAETTLDGVEIIVYVGPQHVDNGVAGSYDTEQFYHEAGQLDCKSGFVPVTHSPFSVTVANNDVPNAAGIQQASSYKAVNGFFLDTLANYMIDAKHLDLKCFHRSSATYSFDGESYVQAGIPYVAITTKSSPHSYASVFPIEPTISENGPAGEFLIVLDKPSWRTIKVRYKLSGTAKNRRDYKRLSGKAKILAGNISTIVKVVPKHDRHVEPMEEITINIKPSKKYNLSGSSSATMAITD